MYEFEKEQQIIECANLLIEYNWSVRVIADNVNVKKTTVHKWLTHDLKYIDDDLYVQCKNILKNHRNNLLRDSKGRFISRN